MGGNETMSIVGVISEFDGIPLAEVDFKIDKHIIEKIFRLFKESSFLCECFFSESFFFL